MYIDMDKKHMWWELQNKPSEGLDQDTLQWNC